MTIAYATLNPILERWMKPTPQSEPLDCHACAQTFKCCDFQPFIGNFLLGAVLEQYGELPKSEGFAWHALGLVPSHQFRRGHAEARRTGQADARWVCVFLDRSQRACKIWSLRPGECSTYLCTPSNPDRQAMSEQAFRVETAVSQMALAYLGFDDRQIGAEIDNLNEPEQGILVPPGDEVFEIYRRAWQWARKLSRDEILGWVDVE